MSQYNVMHVVGQLVTDESCRRRFEKDPDMALRLFIENGIELTPGEMQALANMDLDLLSRFSNSIDPRLQRIDLKGGVE